MRVSREIEFLVGKLALTKWHLPDSICQALETISNFIFGQTLYPPHDYFICLLFSRALEFVHAFLESVLTGEEDLVVCANVAYEKSLKRYHGWIVRGIFKVGYVLTEVVDWGKRDTFLTSLAAEWTL